MITDKKVVFRPFRHIFKDAAKNAHLPDNIIANISGRDLLGGRTAMGGYGQDKVLLWLAEQLAKVRHEGLDLISLVGS